MLISNSNARRPGADLVHGLAAGSSWAGKWTSRVGGASMAVNFIAADTNGIRYAFCCAVIGKLLQHVGRSVAKARDPYATVISNRQFAAGCAFAVVTALTSSYALSKVMAPPPPRLQETPGGVMKPAEVIRYTATPA